MTPALLDVRGLDVGFGPVAAVRGIVSLAPGEVLGLVGESGSGKSVAMRAVLGLLPGTARIAGSVRLQGEELIGRPQRHLRALRGSRMAIIFQDPMTALNPVLPIGTQIAEAITIHDHSVTKSNARDRARALLDLVAIPAPAQALKKFPFELSGGMRQRVAIAIAMANNPDLLIADEPTTALDVTVQAQILELLRRLRDDRGMGMVLITHDLGVIAGLADRVAVMYAGRIVETGPVDALFDAPAHPYTAGLLAATPHIAGGVVQGIEGVPPVPNALPPGCKFAPRCNRVGPPCHVDEPVLRAGGGTLAACHFALPVHA